MTKTIQRARVHRFCGKVALYFREESGEATICKRYRESRFYFVKIKAVYDKRKGGIMQGLEETSNLLTKALDDAIRTKANAIM